MVIAVGIAEVLIQLLVEVVLDAERVPKLEVGFRGDCEGADMMIKVVEVDVDALCALRKLEAVAWLTELVTLRTEVEVELLEILYEILWLLEERLADVDEALSLLVVALEDDNVIAVLESAVKVETLESLIGLPVETLVKVDRVLLTPVAIAEVLSDALGCEEKLPLAIVDV